MDWFGMKRNMEELQWVSVSYLDRNLPYQSQDIRVPPFKMWKPDILLYNSANENFDATFPTNIIVTNSGICSQIPPGIFKSTCRIDITWFPFDDQVGQDSYFLDISPYITNKQTCELKFGTWTHDGHKINLTEADPPIDTSGFAVSFTKYSRKFICF